MAVNAVNNQKTIQEIIDSSSKKAEERNTGALGKDDFLNLLVTQLRYQDPLKPLEDKEFIAQMAQFSSLEQMQNMNTTVTQSQAFSLLGKYITATVSDSLSNEIRAVQGQVSNVKISNGKTFVVVDGEDIPVEKVTNVSQNNAASNLTNLSAYTSLIGYDVSAAVFDPLTADLIGVKGNVTALEKGTYEDYAVLDNVTLDISGIVTDTPSTDPDYIVNYLDERLPEANGGEGKEVELWAVDRKNDQEVPVKAILKAYEKGDDGKITVTLDKVYVPVDSIARITK